MMSKKKKKKEKKKENDSPYEQAVPAGERERYPRVSWDKVACPVGGKVYHPGSQVLDRLLS